MTVLSRAEPDELKAWPGHERRYPGIGDSAYLMHREITRSLVEARDTYLRSGLRILDVGCGVQPYYPLFADIASQYDGNDVEPGPRINFVSPVEALPIEDASYDLVLCTQVLEHVRRPYEALREMSRVLVPGGHLFLSTLGVYPFHPHPADYWRWTQQGFEAIFEDTEGLELVSLVPHGGSASAIAILVNTSVREAGRVLRAPWIGVPLITVINSIGLTIDRLLPGRAKEALVPNFLAVGQRTV
ncbi:MAG TPA: class I SAM-dependent methyltransferase [Polyangiaceae bacterium]